MDPKKEEEKIMKLQEERNRDYRICTMETEIDRPERMNRLINGIVIHLKAKSDEDSEDTTEDEDTKFYTIESSLQDVKGYSKI